MQGHHYLMLVAIFVAALFAQKYWNVLGYVGL